MTYRGVALKAHAGAGWAVALLGLAIPISTALDGVLTGCILLAWVFTLPASARASRFYARRLPIAVGFALFALLAIACLWSSVPWSAAWSSLSKYVDLVLIPVFAWAAASLAARKRALMCFTLGVALGLVISYGSALSLWVTPFGLHSQPSYPTGFRTSITHSIIVALAGFLLLLLARELRAIRPRIALACGAFALVCIANVLFVVIGRTGYVVLGALLIYFAATVARDRRSALVGVLLVSALFAVAYHASQSFATRVQDIASDIREWQPGASDETSVGVRLGYYRTSVQIVREHPLTGVGTGGFAEAYAQRIAGTAAPATRNPHNDYLMLAVQAGIFAVVLLIALYIAFWRDSRRLPLRLERDLLRGVVLAMAIGGLFNSVLMDHVEGLLFAWATGVLYAGLPNPPAAAAS